MNDDDREARRRAAHERAERQLGELLSDVGLESWMRMRRNTHNYSLNNQLLIAAQIIEMGLPDPHTVKAAWRWKLDGYHPVRGSRCLYIWVAKSRRRKDGSWRCCGNVLRAGECKKCGRQAVYFQIGPTFANSQVISFEDGKQPPGPPPLNDITGDSHEWMIDPIESWLWAEHGIPVSWVPASECGTAKGWWSHKTRKITVNGDLAANDRAATLLHEAVHALGASRHQNELTYEENELLAEATAYLVCQSVGLDIGERAAPYIAGWNVYAKQDLGRFAQLIDGWARPIEQALDQIERATPVREDLAA